MSVALILPVQHQMFYWPNKIRERLLISSYRRKKEIFRFCGMRKRMRWGQRSTQSGLLLLLVEREEKGAEAGKRSYQIKVACCARPFSSNMWRVVLPAARTKEEEKKKKKRWWTSPSTNASSLIGETPRAICWPRALVWGIFSEL